MELRGFWTTKTHKRRKETGMNLNRVDYKIGNSVRDSVNNSLWNSVWDSVFNPVRYSVWDSVNDSMGSSVNIGLKGSIRKERKQG